MPVLTNDQWSTPLLTLIIIGLSTSARSLNHNRERRFQPSYVYRHTDQRDIHSMTTPVLLSKRCCWSVYLYHRHRTREVTALYTILLEKVRRRLSLCSVASLVCVTEIAPHWSRLRNPMIMRIYNDVTLGLTTGHWSDYL